MLALRNDIGCAVIGSGRLALLKPPRHSADPARDYFNVADAIPTIAQRRATRILVVTDPADKKVLERSQTGFVQRLRQAGGQAEQFMVQATDDNRHGVVAYAMHRRDRLPARRQQRKTSRSTSSGRSRSASPPKRKPIGKTTRRRIPARGRWRTPAPGRRRPG